jgi:hypothetical protein
MSGIIGINFIRRNDILYGAAQCVQAAIETSPESNARIKDMPQLKKLLAEFG